MPFDINSWDARILEDYKQIQSKYHRIWKNNRDMMNNEGNGSKYGNLVKEYAQAIRARLINENFFISVQSDDPNYSKKAQELTIMVNSLSRTVDLKGALDEATENSLWASTGWLEPGHSLDLNSFDMMRSILHKPANSFNPSEMEDDYVPVPKERVVAELGNSITDVKPFDPFQPPPEPEVEDEPMLTFDPKFGAPWIKVVSPFFIVLPLETKNFEEADYVTKLVLISKPELEFLTEMDIPPGAFADLSLYNTLIEETPGGKHIKEPVVLAITYIRRDRNDPQYTNHFVVHVLGHPNIVIKDSVNPYGGMIPLIPARSSASKRIISKSWVEDLRPYTEENAKVIQAAFKRIRQSLSVKWAAGGNASLSASNVQNLNNPDFNGEIKMESGSPESVQYFDGPGLTQEVIQGMNLIMKIAQGETGQTDIDRGTPIKKISARQTDALLDSSKLTIEAIRGPIVKSGNEAMLKLIHFLNLFSSPRPHVYKFGGSFVEVNPGGNDFTTSFQYAIQVKDLEGPLDVESQMVLVQFISKIAAMPQFANIYNWQELANNVRRAFGQGPEVMMQAQVPGIAGEIGNVDGAMSGMLQGGRAGEHPGRAPGDEGAPSADSARLSLAGMMGGM